MATLKLQDRAIEFGSSERTMLQQAIKEYENLVTRRSRTTETLQTSSVNTTESVLSRFADDAVNSTYGLVWNAVEIPFTITSKKEPDRDLTKLAETLANKIEERQTGFKAALRHILKCYLEYGSGWIYVFHDPDGEIVHRVFSVREIARSLDIYNRPDVIYLDRGDDAFTLVHAIGKNEYKIIQRNTENSRIKDVYSDPIPFSPILELSLTGGYCDKYPIGYGIKAISDLKRYDNIVKQLTVASVKTLNPVAYTSPSVNANNKSMIGINTPCPIGSIDNPIQIDAAIGDRIFPVGYIPTPINAVDAWRIFEIASVNIRESFNFINRLMTIKDNAQMTATEAQIRTSSDISQIRDTIEVIFSFLEELHKTQLFLLKDHPDFEEWKDIDPLDLKFIHTSIFKKESDAQKIMEINQGLDLAGKAIQVGNMVQQAGYGDVIDSRTMLRQVAETAKLATSNERQNSILASLLQDVTQNFGNEA